MCREPVTLLHIEIVFLSHWFVFVSTEPFATLISFCANGIRVVSGLISAGSYFSECPLMLAQRLAPQQPSVTSRVISPNTWCPWDMFSLFRELKDFERNCQRWQNCLWEHSRWWSRCKKYKKKCFSSLIFFFFKPHHLSCIHKSKAVQILWFIYSLDLVKLKLLNDVAVDYLRQIFEFRGHNIH